VRNGFVRGGVTPLFPFPDRLPSVFSALDEKANSSQQDGKTLYLHVMKWPADGKLVVEGMPAQATDASFLSPKAPQGALDIAQSETFLTLTLHAQAIDSNDTVIKVSLRKDISQDDI
jgi:hypothetical protein